MRISASCSGTLSITTGQMLRRVFPTESVQGHEAPTLVVFGSPGSEVIVQVFTIALVAMFRMWTDPPQFCTALPDNTIRSGVSRHWPVAPLAGYRLLTDSAHPPVTSPRARAATGMRKACGVVDSLCMVRR